MSIAVAIKKDNDLVLATDSLVSFGSGQVPSENYQTNKILTVGDAFIATTGWALYDNILIDYISQQKSTPSLHDESAIFTFFLQLWKQLRKDYALVNEQCDDKLSPFADLDASFLIVNPQGIFSVASNMNVIRFEQYYAIGSGSDYSLGALYTLYKGKRSAQAIAKQAVATAIALDTNCGGKINIHPIQPITK
ncbi:MAG: hypothetical protein JKY13_00760 [Gammaproteobacteria bacterium]|nr:hypothetical protein [Gammaproteobacteria bacterium]